MSVVLGFLALLWFGGRLAGAPVGLRLGAMAAAVLAVIGAHLALPPGHGLRAALGGDARSWALLLGLGAVIGGYARVLVALKARARAAEAPAPPAGGFSEAELSRYARHLMLREVGGPGQGRLKSARVLVVGAGGLGSPALLYLAAAGVGTIGVIDHDHVESSNLQRQVIHRDQDIGLPKVQSAARAMRALNPYVTVEPHAQALDAANAPGLFAGYDLILDGTDGFEIRQLINAAAVAARKPLIAAAIGQWEGQISLYDPAHGGPCYVCVFDTPPAPGQAPSCAEAGVLGPLPGVMGAMMALEAIKHIAQAGEPLRGRMLIYDGLYGETRLVQTRPRVGCAVCGGAG